MAVVKTKTTKTKIFMEVRAATVGTQELNINICVFFAPLEQKSWKIIRDNLWSLSAQKYFWLIEPMIIKKILIGFLPVRANKPQMALIYAQYPIA